MPKQGVNIIFYAIFAKIQTLGCIFLANIHCKLYIRNFWSNWPQHKTVYALYSITNLILQHWHKHIGYFGK